MSTDDKSIEGFAKLFHHYHSALAPDFGCGAVRDSEWRDLPANEQKRMVAAVRLALSDVQANDLSLDASTFTSDGNGATEGREWGC